MPLRNGCSVEDVRENIRLLIDEGRPAQQATAIAYSHYYKKCGQWLFVPGWACPADFASLGERQIRAAIAPRKTLLFVGKAGEPKMKAARKKSEQGSVVYGFVVKLEKGDDAKLLQVLKKHRWERSSTEFQFGAGEGVPRLAFLLQPTASTPTRNQCAANERYLSNLSTLWDFEEEGASC